MTAAAAALAGSAMSSGASLGGNIMTTAANIQQNEDSRNFAREQSLSDWNNQLTAFQMSNSRADDVWNRQNAYNLDMYNQYGSPAAMMRQYKEAGLNPNLIYGNASPGMPAIADTEGSKFAGHAATPAAPQIPLDFRGAGNAIGSVMSTMLDLKGKAAGIRNTDALTDNAIKDNQIKDIQAAGLLSDNALKAVTAHFAPQMAKVSLDAATEQWRKVSNDIRLSNNADTRAAALNSGTLQEMKTRMLNLNQDTQNKQLDNQLKQLDLKYRGVGPKATEWINQMIGNGLQNGGEFLRNKVQDLRYRYELNHLNSDHQDFNND